MLAPSVMTVKYTTLPCVHFQNVLRFCTWPNLFLSPSLSPKKEKTQMYATAVKPVYCHLQENIEIRSHKTGGR